MATHQSCRSPHPPLLLQLEAGALPRSLPFRVDVLFPTGNVSTWATRALGTLKRALHHHRLGASLGVSDL